MSPSARLTRLPAIALACVALLAAGAVPAAAHGEPATRTPVAARLQGLRVATSGACAGGYRITGTGFCTHGPDARPAGRRVTLQPRSISAVIEGPLPDAVLCDGDGTSGRRVQAIYARVAGSTSRRATVVPQIRTAAAGVQSAFLASAARTDGVRRPRWVTDDACHLSVTEVVLSEAARKSFNATIAELGAKGFARTDRKYLVWWDTSVYCGIGTFWGDDRPGLDNLSNTRTGYARVDTGCWGWAESHELMHTLGAVQNTAPHTTYGAAPGAFAHCTDEYDVMCYPDAPGVTMTVVCPDRGLDGQFDCGDDDYFDTDPEGGSYLADHWNTADSGWLERTVVALETPEPALAVGGQVASGSVPVVTTLATRAPLAGLERIEAQRRTAGDAWQPVAVPDGTRITTRLATGVPGTVRARTVDAAEIASPWLLGPEVRVRMRDDAGGRLTWSRGWTRPADPDALGGSLHRTRRDGATLTFRTDAAQVGVVAGRGPLAGRLEIRVDGVKRRTLDLSAGTAPARTIVATLTLAPGRHIVVLRIHAPRMATTGWRVDLDAVALLSR